MSGCNLGRIRWNASRLKTPCLPSLLPSVCLRRRSANTRRKSACTKRPQLSHAKEASGVNVCREQDLEFGNNGGSADIALKQQGEEKKMEKGQREKDRVEKLQVRRIENNQGSSRCVTLFSLIDVFGFAHTTHA